MDNKHYIGDGVYIFNDGYGIWLYANDPDSPTDKIYLGPDELDSLVRYLRTIFPEQFRSVEVIEISK